MIAVEDDITVEELDEALGHIAEGIRRQHDWQTRALLLEGADMLLDRRKALA